MQVGGATRVRGLKASTSYLASLAPRGAFRGRAPQIAACAPPKRELCPPKRGLYLKESNSLGDTVEQFQV